MISRSLIIQAFVALIVTLAFTPSVNAAPLAPAGQFLGGLVVTYELLTSDVGFARLQGYERADVTVPRISSTTSLPCTQQNTSGCGSGNDAKVPTSGPM